VKHVQDRRADPATRLRGMAMLSPGPASEAAIAGWLTRVPSLSGLSANDPALFGLIVDELYRQGQRVAVWAREAGLVGRALSKDEALALIAVTFKGYAGTSGREFLDHAIRVGPTRETRKKVQDLLKNILEH